MSLLLSPQFNNCQHQRQTLVWLISFKITLCLPTLWACDRLLSLSAFNNETLRSADNVLFAVNCVHGVFEHRKRCKFLFYPGRSLRRRSQSQDSVQQERECLNTDGRCHASPARYVRHYTQTLFIMIDCLHPLITFICVFCGCVSYISVRLYLCWM